MSTKQPQAFVNLRDKRKFPSAKDIPTSEDPSQDFFIPADTAYEELMEARQDPGFQRIAKSPKPPKERLRHWCTLTSLNSGMIADILHPGEKDWGMHEFGKTDIEETFLMGCGLLADQANGGLDMIHRIPTQRHAGCVAVMYTVDLALWRKPTGERMGTSRFIHAPNVASVRIFPCSIEHMMDINDKLQSRVAAGTMDTCSRCLKPGDNRCMRCKSTYCGPEDWRKHKLECRVIQQIRDWSTFDWEKYEGPYVFPKIQD